MCQYVLRYEVWNRYNVVYIYIVQYVTYTHSTLSDTHVNVQKHLGVKAYNSETDCSFWERERYTSCLHRIYYMIYHKYVHAMVEQHGIQQFPVSISKHGSANPSTLR